MIKDEAVKNRVMAEQEQLEANIIKLADFLDSRRALKDISMDHHFLLRAQLNAMRTYSGILDLRLSNTIS